MPIFIVKNRYINDSFDSEYSYSCSVTWTYASGDEFYISKECITKIIKDWLDNSHIDLYICSIKHELDHVVYFKNKDDYLKFYMGFQ